MINELTEEFPKSMFYFEEYYREKEYEIAYESFKALPFSFQLGVFLSFFEIL